jgi:hypothetical protein
MTDVSETLIPNSDQLDAADLAASGPRIFTIERVVVKSAGAEQPVAVYFKEFPRPWHPGRNMRRVLAHVYGKDSSKWVGHKLELYCDPDVIFGKERVGGTRISRMTGIDGPIKAPIIVGRGKRGTWPVKPLATTTEPLAPTDPMTLMGARMKARGLTVKEDALAYVESIIGRAVASRDEMTPEEIAQVNEAMADPVGEGL